MIDPSSELKGTALLASLRLGGLVLYMRHALNGPPDGSCGGESSLTHVGVQQATAVGIALKRLEIRIGAVWSSETCRATQTASLLSSGEVKVTADLNPAGQANGIDLEQARRLRLATRTHPGTNTVLVSHFHGAKNPQERLFLDYAEIIVFDPKTGGSSLPVARLGLPEWEQLLALPRP